MSNVFITRSNMQKLEYFKKATKKDVDNFIKQYDMSLNKILANPELELLSMTKLVLETINESDHLLEVDYSKLNIKQYKRSENARWIYLGGAPAYHLDINCHRLHQDYLNFEIPSELHEDKISEYRKFFLDNINLLHNDAERFYVRISTKFSLITSQVRGSVQFDNSGFDEMKNSYSDPSEIIRRITDHVLGMVEFKNSTPEANKLISDCGFATHRAMDYKINKKYIDLLGDNPIKKWHFMKQKLKGFIIDHIIATINPEITFKKTILDDAGFIECKECHALHIRIKTNKILQAEL